MKTAIPKLRIIDRILGKYIQKQLETSVKQIKRELIKENKETVFLNHKDILIPAMDKVYELWNQPKPCKFSGYIDLSSIRAGDIIEIVVSFISTDGLPKRFFKKEFMGPLSDPMLTFDEKVVDGVLITIKQTAGTAGRPVLYNWRWIYT